MSRLASFFALITGSFVGLVLFLVPFFAWLTHVIVCIKTASWILLIIGAFVFPIGIVHGVAVWLGLL